jgi:hypothetical protein
MVEHLGKEVHNPTLRWADMAIGFLPHASALPIYHLLLNFTCTSAVLTYSSLPPYAASDNYFLPFVISIMKSV